jgi:hypothetical protein
MPPIVTQILNAALDVLGAPIRLIEETNLFLIAFKVTKALFDVAFYVVVPSLVVSWVSSFLLPFTFTSILPVCLAALIVVNILRS